MTGGATRERKAGKDGMASVQIADVRKAYGSTQVIHGVDIDINDGEFVILVGPSGCGKSTLLRMIAGLENISGGEIRIGPRVVTDVPPKERDIAMVFQNYALYPHMTDVYKRQVPAFARRGAGAALRARLDQPLGEMCIRDRLSGKRADGPATRACRPCRRCPCRRGRLRAYQMCIRDRSGAGLQPAAHPRRRRAGAAESRPAGRDERAHTAATAPAAYRCV